VLARANLLSVCKEEEEDGVPVVERVFFFCFDYYSKVDLLDVSCFVPCNIYIYIQINPQTNIQYV